MNSDPHLQVHITIQKGLSMPPLQKCNCCDPAQVHCPFCLPSFFKPTKRSRARVHMSNHLKRAVYIGEYTIHRCGLECRNQPHYHCLFCAATLLKRRDFISHVPYCHKTQLRRGQKLSWPQTAVTERDEIEGLIAPSLTPGEDDIPSYDVESEDDSDNDDDGDGDEVTIILDSDDQNSQGASSSSSSSSNQLMPPIIRCDTVGMKRSMEPQSSKCHRSVQTNIEKPQDCDEYYFMSLVKMFKKLSPQKKTKVRMKIERLLFEAEFE